MTCRMPFRWPWVTPWSNRKVLSTTALHADIHAISAEALKATLLRWTQQGNGLMKPAAEVLRDLTQAASALDAKRREHGVVSNVILDGSRDQLYKLFAAIPTVDPNNPRPGQVRWVPTSLAEQLDRVEATEGPSMIFHEIVTAVDQAGGQVKNVTTRLVGKFVIVPAGSRRVLPVKTEDGTVQG